MYELGCPRGLGCCWARGFCTLSPRDAELYPETVRSREDALSRRLPRTLLPGQSPGPPRLRSAPAPLGMGPEHTAEDFRGGPYPVLVSLFLEIPWGATVPSVSVPTRPPPQPEQPQVGIILPHSPSPQICPSSRGVPRLSEWHHHPLCAF